MSDNELGAKIYAAGMDKHTRDIQIAAARELEITDLLSNQADPEALLRPLAVEVARSLGTTSFGQIRHPKRHKIFHRRSVALDMLYISAPHGYGSGRYEVSTPPFGTELSSYNELALNVGWLLRFTFPAYLIKRYNSDIRDVQTFDILRVAQNVIDPSVRSTEAWYRIRLCEKDDKLIQSEPEANDVELTVMQEALRQKHLDATCDVTAHSDVFDYDEANERYRDEFRMLPTAGSRAVMHCTSLLMLAQTDLRF